MGALSLGFCHIGWVSSMDALAFIPVSVLIALGPGPNNLCAMNNGLRAGTGKALVATWGRVAAFALFLTASALGLGAMLLASELAFSIIKWIGAAYLLWLGWSTWRSKDTSILQAVAQQPVLGATAGVPVRKMVAQEFTLAITNPKAMVLFAAVFPQFIDPSRPPAEQFMVLGPIYLAAEFVATTAYASFGQWLKRVIHTPIHALRINKTTGGLYMGAGGLLLSVQRS